MAKKFCTQCGSEISEGKRFCARCGAAVVQRPGSPEALSPQVREIVSGKADAPADKTSAVVSAGEDAVAYRAADPITKQPAVSISLAESSPQVLFESGVPGPPAPRNQPEAVSNGIVSPGDQAASVIRSAGSREETMQQALEVPTPLESTERFADTTPILSAAPKTKANQNILFGAGVGMLILAVGAGGFYAWHKKAPSPITLTEKTADIIMAPAATTTTSSNDTAQATSITSPTAKPDAGTPVSVSDAARTPQESAQTHNPASESVRDGHLPAPPISRGKATQDEIKTPLHLQAADTVDSASPASIERQGSVNSRSGILRCSGPPIQFGQTVTFSGLPGAMLRFSFDHTIWQPRISHLPDGTQALTLRSLSQQQQSDCEVRWKLAQDQ